MTLYISKPRIVNAVKYKKGMEDGYSTKIMNQHMAYSVEVELPTNDAQREEKIKNFKEDGYHIMSDIKPYLNIKIDDVNKKVYLDNNDYIVVDEDGVNKVYSESAFKLIFEKFVG